jgi:integrase
MSEFRRVLEMWLNGSATSLKDHRALVLRSKHVLKFVDCDLKDVPMRASQMVEAGLKAGLRPATINRRLAIARRVLNIAFDTGLTDVQYGRRVKMLPEKNTRHTYLTTEEIEALCEAAGNCGDALRFLAYTGLRLGEMFSLQPGDVVDGRVILRPENTKTSRPRTVPLPAVVADKATPWLWPGVTTLRRRFSEARMAIGKPDLHIHDLRHTYASLLCVSGAPMTAVRDLLGHTSIAVTNRYSHLSTGHLEEAVAML